MKILNELKTDSLLADMRDGQIAIITKWPVQEYIGLIVQRYGNSLITLGEDVSHSWSNLFENQQITQDKFRVRFLPKGTVIEL